MEMNEVKQKARELKETIEQALAKFRKETGYIPKVDITTIEKATNDGSIVRQQAFITLQL